MSVLFPRIGAASALCLALAFPSMAGAQGAPAAPPDSARLALARRLVVAMHFSDKFSKEVVSGFTAAQTKELPASVRDSLLAQFVKAGPELVDSLVPIYAAGFDRTDLEGIVKFYESPLGQRYVTAQSEIEAKTMVFVKRWAMRLVMATMTRMVDQGQLNADSL